MPVFKRFGNDQIIGEFNFRSLKHQENYLPIEGLKVYPIELSKGTNISDLSPIKQTWINFLKSSTENISKPIEIEEIHEAYEKMKSIGGDKVYINYLEAREKYEINKYGEINTAKEAGIKEGEHKKAIETAKNFLKMGLTIEQVSNGTGLTIDEIKMLL